MAEKILAKRERPQQGRGRGPERDLSGRAFSSGKARKLWPAGRGKILIRCVAAANIGYTLFLFPVGAFLFPESVPFTIVNALAFFVLDSLAGLVLGLFILLLRRMFKVGLKAASGIALVFLWLLYWLPYLERNIDVLMLAYDGLAAGITWAALIWLCRQPRKRAL